MISSTSNSLAQRLSSIILVIMLCSALILQFAASRRGFDFTDESYYLLNYLYYNKIETLISLFGAYLHFPFLLMKESIWGIRVVGIVLLLITTTFFAHYLWSSSARLWGVRLPVKMPFYLTVMMAGFGFYSAHFATLITPGYNLLSLITMLITTAIVLDALGREFKRRGDALRAFIYGLVMSICFFNKFSTALALFVIHVILVITVTGRIHINNIPARQWIFYSVAGFTANAVALWLAIPDLPTVLVRGFTFFTTALPRHVLSEIYTLIIHDVPDIILLSVSGGFWFGLIGFALALTGITHHRKTLLEVGVIIIIAPLLLDGIYRWMPQARLARNFELLLGLLAVYYGAMRRREQQVDISPRLLIFLLLLMILPLVYSFGTNVIFFSILQWR